MRSINQLVGVAALLGVCSTGALAQYSIRLATDVERIENPLLDAMNPGGVTVLRGVADYVYELQGERSKSRFSAGAVIERSSDTALLASRNYPSLGYTWTYNWPTANLELRANLAESATRNTLFEDLGRVTVDARERTTVTGAIWNTELTERTNFTLDVANNRVRYDSPLLESYRELRTSTRFSWEATERSLYYVEPGYARLTPLNAGPDSTLTRLVGGMRRDLAPEWSLTAHLGQARTRGVRRSSDVVGGLRLTYTGSRLTSSVDWARDIQPIGTTTGYVRTEVLGGLVGYQVAEGTRVSAGITRSRIASVTGGVGYVSRLALEKELADRWSSILSVEDRRFRGITGAPGRGWAIRAGVAYTYSEL